MFKNTDSVKKHRQIRQIEIMTSLKISIEIMRSKEYKKYHRNKTKCRRNIIHRFV